MTHHTLCIATVQFFFFTLLLLPFQNSSAQENVFDETAEKIKLFNANQIFNEGDYRSALNLYKDVLKRHPKSVEVLLHIADCLLAMEQIDEAVEYFEKASEWDTGELPEFHLDYGKALHLHSDIDKAIVQFLAYKKQLGNNIKKIKESRVEAYLQQCATAKELMAKPLDVTITNMGDLINSKYDDKGPCITADGKMFVFTSRRPSSKGIVVDKEGDLKYFEDVFYSEWDEQHNTWYEAERIKGSINTEGHDAVLSISPSGKQIFLYKNNPDEGRGGEIFVSKVSASGRWGTPKNIGKPVNTSYVENGACVSPDGKTLYFVSERPKGGYGRGDIWMCKKKTKTQWGTPANLGPVVNTPEDEGGIFLHPDGKTLFFTSEGHNSMGSYDLFYTTNENGKWSPPIHLGYPINSVRKDMVFVLSTDNKTGYFSSDRPGGMGERDLYSVDMSRYLIMEQDKKKADGPGLSILTGQVFNSDAGQAMEVEITVTDKATEKKVGSTTSSPEGNYFFTLPAEKTYLVEINKKGYTKISEEVFLRSSGGKGTFSLVKHFILYKDNKQKDK